MMSRHDLNVVEFPQPSGSGSCRAARKLIFENKDDNTSGEFNNICPLTWRNVNQDLECSDQELDQPTYCYDGFGSKGKQHKKQGYHGSSCHGNVFEAEVTDTWSVTFTSTRRARVEVDSDEFGQLSCRESSASTDISASKISHREKKELSQNLRNLTNVMVGLNLEKCQSESTDVNIEQCQATKQGLYFQDHSNQNSGLKVKDNHSFSTELNLEKFLNPAVSANNIGANLKESHNNAANLKLVECHTVNSGLHLWQCHTKDSSVNINEYQNIDSETDFKHCNISDSSVNVQQYHTSNSGVYFQQCHTSNSDLNFKQCHTTHSDLNFQQCHTSNSDLNFQQCQTSNSGVNFQQCHTSNSDLNFKQCHTTHSDLNFQQCHTSNSDLSFQQCHTTNSDLNFKQYHTTNSDLNFKQCHTTYSDLNFQQCQTSNSDLSFQQCQTSNSDLNFQQCQTSNSGVNFQQCHTSNSDLNFKQYHTTISDLNFKQFQTSDSDLNFKQCHTSNSDLNFKQFQTDNSDLNFKQRHYRDSGLNFQQCQTSDSSLNFKQFFNIDACTQFKQCHTFGSNLKFKPCHNNGFNFEQPLSNQTDSNTRTFHALNPDMSIKQRHTMDANRDLVQESSNLRHDLTSSKSEMYRFKPTKIKFRPFSSKENCTSADIGSRRDDQPSYHVDKRELEAISYMLRNCEQFHPLDMEPKTARRTPNQSPVRSLMDGGDAVDVRGLANRLSHMKSESRMRQALKQYVNTHVPSMEGKMDGIIEDTVLQIANVSLGGENKSSTENTLTAITASEDWLKLQGTNVEPQTTKSKGAEKRPGFSRFDFTKAATGSVIEVDMHRMSHWKIDAKATKMSSGVVSDVCSSKGELVNSEYISPEEYRFAAYSDRKRKRRLQEVSAGSESIGERTKRKGKKRVSFAYTENECSEIHYKKRNLE